MPIFLGHQTGKHAAAWTWTTYMRDMSALAAEQPKHRVVR